ncbi:hypothetical protein DKM44_04060 [Deinococcus irradiatisoli]|uniref:Uncharacterized protein n=1 Tax=Deinococcus irradiatisoli TaxID=2202254 RepID=A0A2Z3JGA6_9DEIO|nr:hypothetical protein [Deinococcus irradiatisoli]AWN22511.1 hypothetical protein DKM44_04060 [Deinococcus irradiatisoli]
MQTLLAPFDGEWFEVTTPQQARLLSDPVALRHFTPFVGQTLSASQAAQAAGVSVARLLYWVKQFLASGLLREVRRDARAGRPVRIYQGVAAGFHVPFELTDFADLEERLRRQLRPLEELRSRAAARALAQRGISGRLIYRSAQGVHSETALPEGLSWEALGGGVGSDFQGLFWLSPQDADWMRAELGHLRAELQRRQQGTGRGRPYLVQTVLQEVTPEEAGEA